MKRIAIIALLTLVCGCQSKAPAASEDAKVEVSPQKEDNSPQLIAYEAKAKDELQNRVMKTGELPPVMDIVIGVKQVSENLSATDADRAKLFANPHISLCYKNALAYNTELAYETQLTLKIDGTGKVEGVAFAPSAETEVLANCLNDAAKQFRLPKTRNGAAGEVIYTVSLKSKKAPNMGDVVKEHREGDDNHHH